MVSFFSASWGMGACTVPLAVHFYDYPFCLYLLASSVFTSLTRGISVSWWRIKFFLSLNEPLLATYNFIHFFTITYNTFLINYDIFTCHIICLYYPESAFYFNVLKSRLLRPDSTTGNIGKLTPGENPDRNICCGW